jgi:hypothetical protein
MPTEMTMPRSRVEQLVIQEMPEETLVYDLDRHKAHCLNEAASVVWRHCDGATSAGEVARMLHEQTGLPADERIVWLAVGDLRKARLLDGPVATSSPAVSTGRREALKRIGLVGGLAAALPIISSIVAPTAVSAVTCLAQGQPCADTGQCCQGLVCAGPLGMMTCQ